MMLTWDEACVEWWGYAVESLSDDLYDKLGRDPSADEIDAFITEDRIADRISCMRERFEEAS